ncbi:MAG TPA: EAL domain-containing protein [Thermoanaerobaculia bacterium]|nr:EAL domain-containing protein [Thermoanaerobaculia bacterium]
MALLSTASILPLLSGSETGSADPGDDSQSLLHADDGLQLSAGQMPPILWTTDRDLRFGLGVAPGLRNRRSSGSLVDYIQGCDPDSVPTRAHRLALEGEPVSFDQEWNGRHFQIRVEPLRDAAGQITGCMGVAVDITERKHSEEALYREKERAQVTLASIGDGVIRTDAAGLIDYLNPVAERLTGWSMEDALGRPVTEVFQVVDEVTRQPVADPVQRCLTEGRAVESPGYTVLLSAGGKEYSVRDSSAPIYDRSGAAMGAVLVFKDVTQIRGMEREMIYLASHDPLTGLINRREFEIRLKRAIRNARAERRQHVLLYLDLDEFKVVNDTCGHLVGDEMLRQITALLRSRVRRSDVLARLGGDEFGVLLEDCPLDHARQIAEEMRRTVREFRFCWKDQIFEVGVSIGLVPINHDSGDLASVMSAADAACYVAKDGGRNRVHEYELDDTAVAERYGEMQWIHRIHAAFDDRRFRLFYQLIQPLAAENSSRELLCEVFVRMLDRNGKIIEPSAFIAAAERYHLMSNLDRWVIKTAFKALAEAQRREVSRPVLFAINLSGQSLSDDSFLAFVVEELENSSVDPRRICFEITETAAISKLDGAMHFIGALKAKGCRFILDDFGSGLSSFAYLRDLAVDFLKIDGEFVQNMLEDRVKRAMVESINQIGHVMGLQTIAEWVESRQTLEALRDLGVDYAQGYWLCHPQPLVHDV